MITGEDMLILKELKRDSRQTTRDLAKNTKLSSSTVHRRMNSLIDEGYIKQYTIVPDWEKLDRGTLAYILLSVDYEYINKEKFRQAEIAEMIRKHPFVFEASTVTGSKDIILKVRVKDIKELDMFIDYLRKIDGIKQTETRIVLHDASRHDNPFEKPWFE